MVGARVTCIGNESVVRYKERREIFIVELLFGLFLSVFSESRMSRCVVSCTTSGSVLLLTPHMGPEGCK